MGRARFGQPLGKMNHFRSSRCRERQGWVQEFLNFWQGVDGERVHRETVGFRREHKRICSSEQEAFARLFERSVAKKKYVWEAKHTEKSLARRRVE